MRIKMFMLSITLLTAATARAAEIQYNEIPSDTTSYMHIDLDRLLSSRLARDVAGKEMGLAVNDIAGEHSDFTVYLPKSGGPGGYVVLWHTRDPKVRKHTESVIADAKTNLTINYGQQEIHYASNNAMQFWFPPDDSAPSATPKDPKKPVTTTDNPGQPDEKPSSTFSLGMGDNQHPADFNKGPTYIAFVGQDLILIAGNLPSITNALDVMQGKKPSLTQQAGISSLGWADDHRQPSCVA